jgi:hypothetical protein
VTKRLTVEDIVSDELKREMNLDEKTFAVTDNWDAAMGSLHRLPFEHSSFVNRVGDMKLLKEMIDTLASADFDAVKRSESRKMPLEHSTKSLTMFYNVVFMKGKRKLGYAALIHIPKLKANPERSPGVVLASKIHSEGGKHSSTFERGKFDDFLVEVKPYINLLGDLYRQTRKL